MINDIKQQFSSELAKKIFGNKVNALQFLKKLNEIEIIKDLYNSKGKIS